MIMLDLQLDEINVINRMDIDIHERRLRQEEEKAEKSARMRELFIYDPITHTQTIQVGSRRSCANFSIFPLRL